MDLCRLWSISSSGELVVIDTGANRGCEDMSGFDPSDDLEAAFSRYFATSRFVRHAVHDLYSSRNSQTRGKFFRFSRQNSKSTLRNESKSVRNESIARSSKNFVRNGFVLGRHAVDMRL